MELHDLKEQDEMLQREKRLEQNELARAMSRARDQIGGHLPLVAGGLIGLVVLGVLAVVLLRGGEVETQEAWQAYLDTQGADGFEEVAEEYASTPAAPWALVQAGRERLNSGIRRAFSDRIQSEEDLLQARELFEQALAMPELPIELELQARQGIAVATESVADGSEGSIEEAIAAYQPLLNSGVPKFVGFARSRIAALESGRTQEFYAWLAGQDLAPAKRPQPFDGIGAADDVGSTPNQTMEGALPSDDLLPGVSGESSADPDAVMGQGDSRPEAEQTIDARPDADAKRTDSVKDADTEAEIVGEKGAMPDDQNPETKPLTLPETD